DELLLAFLGWEFHNREVTAFMIYAAVQGISAEPVFVRNHFQKPYAQFISQEQHDLKRVFFIDERLRRFTA
ncbi:hypothetical protein, partial [Brucella tritici]|uniref:hypothetical protein n=1 Tax=Brucella tritici TaxID=94626 RepID=UPI0015917C97